MAEAGEKAAKQLREITECPICMSAFTDPRVLSCIHTFCLECLKSTSEAAQLKPGDKMPCPLCRKEFIIPADGMNGVQKNFFMENLLQYKTTLQFGSVAIICDICNASDEGKTGQIPTATMRCLECQDNYCDSCAKVHQFHKLSRNHQVVKIGSDTKSEMKRPFTTKFKYCSDHTEKPLDYYCADCKKIVCVSCFVESHASHKCKDVTKLDAEFRQTIQKNSSKVSIYADEMLSLRKNAEIRKADFLNEIVDKENAIHKRNQELKAMIDEQTELLLNELSGIKSKHVKGMETGLEEIDRYCTIFRSFEAYCTELISRGSASDSCSSVDELVIRADELERDHEAFIGRPYQLIEVSFKTKDLSEVSHMFHKNIVVGQIKETTSQFKNFVFVVGIADGTTITKDVIKINLHRSDEITTQKQIPTAMADEAAAAVYCNTMYVTGVGANTDEIWKYNVVSGWIRCALLAQPRCRHSAAFIDEVMYICGGDSYGYHAIYSVEAFNAVTNKCKIVGKSVHAVTSSGNCVPFRSSLYIFGGKDWHHKEVSNVQMYNTKLNTCVLLTKPMPRPNFCMRAALWQTSVILIGQNTCFIFDFEAETWQEREQFKTDVIHFGLVIENGRVFVVGGRNTAKNSDGEIIWTCRDDVRYVPLQNVLENKPIEWRIHAKLPKPSVVQASAVMRMTV